MDAIIMTYQKWWLFYTLKTIKDFTLVTLGMNKY